MKTMTNGPNVVRVKEQDVKAMLDRGYKYCPKSLWKEVRDKK
jgi:hypothetical protein